ncbi:MAG: hypothetical protein ABSD67_05220 [Terracidiphilus sp.]
MAIVVVGGSGRNVGKTALICGLIAELKELRWTAVKISSHNHGKQEPVWEETTAGTGTDTARYLAAGAERALLISADGDELGAVVRQLIESQEPETHLILESNQVLIFLQPDICLAVLGNRLSAEATEMKPSFRPFLQITDALISPTGEAILPEGFDPAKPVFRQASVGQVPREMVSWVGLQLHARLHS